MKVRLGHEINRQLKRAIALLLMGTIGATSIISVAALSKQVNIVDGDNVSKFTTLASNTDKILEQAGIELKVNDIVEVEDSQQNAINITVRRAVNVSINTGDETKEVICNVGETVSDALNKAEVSLGVDDTVEPGLDESLKSDTTITVHRMCNVSVTVDGQTNTIKVPSGTVEDALNYANIQVGKDDVISVDSKERVTEGMNIAIGRVEYRQITRTEAVAYNTINIKTKSLAKGTTQVRKQGVNGEREVTVREKLIDGNVVETIELSSVTIKNAISEEVLVGSGRAASSKGNGHVINNNNGTFTDHNGAVVAYKSVMHGKGTAYTSPAGATTSTGALAEVGKVAVNPNVIPYGTKMYIVSSDGKHVYGYAVAADTGSALMNGTVDVDLYYNTYGECLQFGRRPVTIYFL